MINFILGTMIGVFLGFALCAILFSGREYRLEETVKTMSSYINATTGRR